MTKSYNEGSLKKYAIYLAFIQRCLLIVILLGAFQFGLLTPSEFQINLFIILPCSAAYASFIVHQVRSSRRYFLPGEVLDPFYFWINLLPLMITGLAEYFLIFIKDALFSGDQQAMFTCFALFETLMGVFVGLRLSAIFRTVDSAQKEKI